MRGSDAMKQRGTFALIRSTLQGHKAPDLGVTGATCLIYTASCIYALDDDGFCQDVLPLGVSLSQSMLRIKGAQYVAALEAYSAEGLVADPRIGTRALFVGRGTGTKQALLRTGPITRVDFREGSDEPNARRRHWGASDVELSAMDLGWQRPTDIDPSKTYQQLPVVQLPD
jgi:hypothetical protein